LSRFIQQLKSMRETDNIADLFSRIQSGSCWTGYNFAEILSDIPAGVAAQIPEKGNSIWQQVNHLIYWRRVVMLRLLGRNERPEGPDMYDPEDKSENSWQSTITEFNQVFAELSCMIQDFPLEKLDEQSPREGQTYRDLLYGFLQHDTYHMGQMVYFKKLFQ
jgi:uncharacterized damage-inducible protein DinB